MIYLNDHIEDLELQEVLGKLSPQRLQQLMRFKQERDRKLCAAAYLLLCEGLRKEYGIMELPVFEYGKHGKPSIVGHPEIFFNLSHCREAAICAIANRPVGVDIESVRHCTDTLMRYVLNDAEYDAVKSSPIPQIAFTRIWTQKESLLKLTGEGLRNDLKGLLPAPYRFTTVVHAERNYVYTLCME